jgi:probable rRNA maturation factor
MSQYQIEITDHQESSVIDHGLLKLAILRVLSEEGVQRAKISVALVNDTEIHDVNRRFLAHDYPTDVISFRFDEQIGGNGKVTDRTLEALETDVSTEVVTNSPVSIEGELIVSFETAIREAGVHGWSPEAELLLYVVHGVLHLCGYDDTTDEARPVMRTRERELLAIWGFCPTGLEP